MLAVELLTAALTASHAGFEASSFFDDRGGPPRIGQAFIAIAPGALGASAQAVAERVRAITERILAEPGVRLPGDRRLALRAKHRAEGIPIRPRFLRPFAASPPPERRRDGASRSAISGRWAWVPGAAARALT